MTNNTCYYGANIYDRQERKKGWVQDRLKRARVALIGDDFLSHFLLCAFTGLGIGHKSDQGHITIYGYGNVSKEDKGKYPFYLESKVGEYKPVTLQNIGLRINPYLDIKGLSWIFSKKDLDVFFKNEDLIVEATNDLAIKEMFTEYSRENNKPLISVSCDKNKTKFLFNHFNQDSSSTDFKEFDGRKQNIITGELGASIVADEVRKFLNPLPDDSSFPKKRWMEIKLFDNPPDHPDIDNRHMMIVGFGTGGCLETPSYVSLGIERLDIVDPDFIEATNLNRQWLFYCSIGKWKVDVGRRRLKMINPNLRIRAYKKTYEDIQKAYFKKNSPDIVVDGVDNYKTRYNILQDSLGSRIPYVSAGGTFESGRVVTTYPGQTSCLECLMSVSKLKDLPRAPCPWERNPSIVTSNMAISALVISEVLKVLDPRYGKPFNGILRYESHAIDKIVPWPTQEVCNCHERKDYKFN